LLVVFGVVVIRAAYLGLLLFSATNLKFYIALGIFLTF
jgi:hypothetical protein